MLAQVWAECRGPVAFSAEVQYVKTPGCDQCEIKKKAEREHMKITTCIFIYFLHFALTFKFRKYVFTQETLKFLCQSQYSLLLPDPIALDAGKLIFFFKYLILSVYLKCVMLWNNG